MLVLSHKVISDSLPLTGCSVLIYCLWIFTVCFHENGKSSLLHVLVVWNRKKQILRKASQTVPGKLNPLSHWYFPLSLLKFLGDFLYIKGSLCIEGNLQHFLNSPAPLSLDLYAPNTVMAMCKLMVPKFTQSLLLFMVKRNVLYR